MVTSTMSTKEIMRAEGFIHARRQGTHVSAERDAALRELKELPLPTGVVGHQVLVMRTTGEIGWLGDTAPVVDTIEKVWRDEDNGCVVATLAESEVDVYLRNGQSRGMNGIKYDRGYMEHAMVLPPAGMTMVPTADLARARNLVSQAQAGPSAQTQKESGSLEL